MTEARKNGEASEDLRPNERAGESGDPPIFMRLRDPREEAEEWTDR